MRVAIIRVGRKRGRKGHWGYFAVLRERGRGQSVQERRGKSSGKELSPHCSFWSGVFHPSASPLPVGSLSESIGRASLRPARRIVPRRHMILSVCGWGWMSRPFRRAGSSSSGQSMAGNVRVGRVSCWFEEQANRGSSHPPLRAPRLPVDRRFFFLAPFFRAPVLVEVPPSAVFNPEALQTRVSDI